MTKKITTKPFDISKTRKHYLQKLVLRSVLFIVVVILYIFKNRHNQFDILENLNYFKKFSVFHILWIIWIIDMFYQLIPIKGYIALGSRKNFKHRFKPITDRINKESLKKYIISNNKSAYTVFSLWTTLILLIGIFLHFNIIDNSFLLIISSAFYVCDLICVLIWCPFRLILKTKCCTTCRIFNWDHMMMFTPMIYIKGFFSISLIFIAFIIWLVWEFCVFLYPERFWENSNAALKCSECTDKLCTQYCQRLRKPRKNVNISDQNR